jgi:4-amino-4-deoxychorismate lyase
MSLFLETICVKNGIFQHLAYHQARMIRSVGRQDFIAFDVFQEVLQKEMLNAISKIKGLVKCRVLYAPTHIEKIEFLPYLPSPPKTLQLIEVPHLAYPHKYADRKNIEALQTQKGEADDVLTTQQGFITDTSYCNIAFFDGKTWFTPQKPLLEGTTRARLLVEGILQTASIHTEDLPRFSHLRLFNAMLAFEEAHEAVLLPENEQIFK